eukprot:5439658-Karenia_brevis.AAC.1
MQTIVKSNQCPWCETIFATHAVAVHHAAVAVLADYCKANNSFDHHLSCHLRFPSTVLVPHGAGSQQKVSGRSRACSQDKGCGKGSQRKSGFLSGGGKA